VSARDDRLLIAGWVASAGAGPLENFKVLAAGEQLAGGQLTKGIASPDVAAAYPSLDSAENARFWLVIPLGPGGSRRIRDRLLKLIPVFGGREGWGWFRLLDPTLPFPGQEGIDLVGGEFLGSGLDIFTQLVQRAGLKPGEDILDVGCGTGRVAYVLTYYMDARARYEGFDVVERLVRWAEAEITSRFPNFRFRTVDLYNRMYNPKGKLKADNWSFPYSEESFDVVFLASVFTHVTGSDLRRYLAEIRRVLRPGGRSLCTCFLLNEEVHALIRAGKSDQNLVHELGDRWTVSREVPEEAVGFDEQRLARWIADEGLLIKRQYPGSWCGRGGTVYQDTLVLQKPD
jgi:SAM-dependent methyltransferase